MIEEEDRFFLPAPCQGGEKATPTRRRLKDLAGDGFFIKNLFEESCSFYLVSGRVDRLDLNILLKVAGGFV